MSQDAIALQTALIIVGTLIMVGGVFQVSNARWVGDRDSGGIGGALVAGGAPLAIAGVFWQYLPGLVTMIPPGPGLLLVTMFVVIALIFVMRSGVVAGRAIACEKRDQPRH